jgi:hypothetical protein
MGTPGTSARGLDMTDGLIDLLQAAVTGLKPKTTYLLALVDDRENPNTVTGIPKLHQNLLQKFDREILS